MEYRRDVSQNRITKGIIGERVMSKTELIYIIRCNTTCCQVRNFSKLQIRVLLIQNH